MFDIDVPTGGGAEGPFITWQAKESLDGSIPGRTWVIRTAEGKTKFEAFAKGVILDVHNMKTGWCYSTGQKGVTPEWLWNATIKKFAPQPPDRGNSEHRWQRGFSIRVAFGKGPEDRAIWEQAQGGAWQGFAQLVELLKAAGDQGDKLPVVKQIGAERIESRRGVTFAPKFEIAAWVARPDNMRAEEKVALGDEAPW